MPHIGRCIERKTPRRMRWRVILEKKFSTAFSQEVEAGVKWKVPLSVAGVDSVILGRAFRAPG